MFFGGGGRSRRAPNKGKDVYHQLGVSLEDMYNGTSRKLALQKNVVCDKCEGRGGKAGAVQKCTTCKGTGTQVIINQFGAGMYQQIQTVCRDCDGQGERINPKDMCKTCQGHKIVKERKILEVHVDKGMEDGQKITFYGEGDQVPGLEPGDIVIVLEEKEHAMFRRREMDLFMKMDITLTEALCGFRRPIKTLDNRTIVITSHPGEVIKPNDSKCVLNEGMPMYKHPHERGRLIITFNVTFPENGEIPAYKVDELETLLPPRPQLVIPSDAEELNIIDIDPSYNRRGGRGRGAAHDEDMDEDGMGGMPGGRRVQCANQ